MQFTKEFEDFLKSNAVVLAKLLEVMKAFHEVQVEPVDVGSSPDDPEHFEIGGTPKFETVGLTHADLDALARGRAEAHVKEKALAWVKGFIAGITLVT